LLVGVAIFLALAGAVGWFLLTKGRTGLRYDGDHVTRTGTYRSLDACSRDVEKMGGWCGKNCRDYGEGIISDCAPNLAIPKK
jgi:hypothetical protein